ncbi:uncharacterized protein LOC130965349 [Arachis stenosperma]|uniref:uncharacterized protein LOC130965349 n=1 Tax=Arachis stenosperma TaxID=217475 RepID=UPI0025AC96D4|nr:uncharacterized protein LOC130965349 [Arachis stenosperma]
MEVVLGPGDQGRAAGAEGAASVASQGGRRRSPHRHTRARPFGGTGGDSAIIMQELRHRVQNLERQLADRERDGRSTDPSYTPSPGSEEEDSRRSRPRTEAESSREESPIMRRRNDTIIYSRGRPTHRATRGREDGRTRQPVIMGATPFHRSILEVRLPKHFDKPTDMRYDGTQDPLEHLTAFEARMNLEGVGDEVRCRAFPVTLAGPAIRWFNGLPQGSIYNFADISRAFLAQFTTRIAKAKHPINLLGPVWTMHEIQTVAKEYINDEEVSRVVAANKRQSGYGQARQSGGDGERAKEKAKEEASNKAPRPFPRVGKFTNYTPLTLPIVEVYQQIAEKGILPKPRPLKDRTGGNKSLYCDYHKGYGHQTRDCFDLKDALEQAIREGKLAAFSHLIREPRRRYRDQDEEGKTRSTKRRQEPEDGDHGLTVINVVTAKNTAPKSRSAHKKDAKVLAISSPPEQSTKKPPSISFGPEDQWFSDAPENPPMDADLTTHRHGVIGLGDHFIKPDGVISLPISVGQVQGRRSAMAEFVILRDSTAYNIILGRKTINDFEAIINTKLLVMKFVTDDGSIGTISRGGNTTRTRGYPLRPYPFGAGNYPHPHRGGF